MIATIGILSLPNFRVYQVVPESLHYIWDEVVPFLNQALEYGQGKFLADDIYHFISDGIMQLWIVFDNYQLRAVGVTEIIPYPRKKSLLICFVSGIKAKQWLSLVDHLCMYAKDHGCDMIETYTRKGFEKLLGKFGFQKVHSVLKFDLTD